jgi:indole-3-glycerol phosphate synthase
MSILDEIVTEKAKDIDRLKVDFNADALRSLAAKLPPARDLIRSLRTCDRVPIIAEIKRASPSAGRLADVPHVPSLARAYEAGGAAALSVITERAFFGGGLVDLSRARKAVEVPLLRKDFILDVIQISESRIAGADAVLLIAAALTEERLKELFTETLCMGMTPLVEVHDESELDRVLELDPPIVGINNRNLTTMEVDLETCVRLRPRIPGTTLVVGESGIRGAEDIARLRAAGLDAFLVGTTLVKSKEPAAELSRLCNAEVTDGSGQDLRNNRSGGRAKGSRAWS